MNAVGPPVWVVDLAERFWADAGEVPARFPRELAVPAAIAALITPVERPGLRVKSVVEYLTPKGVPIQFAEPDRPLRAALYCWKGAGYVFLDPGDPPAERRFSFAHELSHFLRDYAAPRRQVERSLGPAALDVLDGLRKPTTDERLYAVLRNRPLTPHCHFMSRDPAGRPKGEGEQRAEADADRLAFELLAPAERFRPGTDLSVIESRLVAEFGLPAAVAAEYANLLSPPPPPVGGLIARLTDSL
ncbi:MAG: ImmA/IrrE family metallo-endopeptidase [Gemmataceae bacterium]